MVQQRYLNRITQPNQLPNLRPRLLLSLSHLSRSRPPLHAKRYDLLPSIPDSKKLTLNPASHPYAHLGFEVVNTIFYFSGFIALSVFIGKLLFCRGSVCAAARADAAFAAFSWMLWTASSVVVAMKIFRGGFKGLKTDKQATSAMKEVPAQP